MEFFQDMKLFEAGSLTPIMVPPGDDLRATVDKLFADTWLSYMEAELQRLTCRRRLAELKVAQAFRSNRDAHLGAVDA